MPTLLVKPVSDYPKYEIFSPPYFPQHHPHPATIESTHACPDLLIISKVQGCDHPFVLKE